jgi:hypothetical protein
MIKCVVMEEFRREFRQRGQSVRGEGSYMWEDTGRVA